VTNVPRKILIVTNEDDLELPELTEELMSAGFELIAAPDAQSARRYMETNGLPHLMVIDLLISDVDGLQFCQEMYEAAGMPIITISRNGDTAAAVEALKFADDFVRRKYAKSEELSMRIRRVLSRIQNFSYATGPEIQIADWLSVDHVNRQVTVRGEARKLTPTENALLSVLLAHRGKIVDADTLIERVWRLDPSVKDRNALRVHIHRLRNKIETDPDDPIMILTERGIGYSFADAPASN
jgi:DNA-binding response OmpR family regulator